jgi:hypothetical protein
MRLLKNKKLEAAKQVIEQVKSKGMAAEKLTVFEKQLTPKPSKRISISSAKEKRHSQKRKKLAEAKKDKKRQEKQNLKGYQSISDR